MGTNMTTEEQTDSFKKNNPDIPANELVMIDDVAKMTEICHRMFYILKKLGNEPSLAFAKHLFAIKASLDEHFPLRSGDMSVADLCPICLSRSDDEDCTHAALVRMSLLFMAAMRHHPPTDMDTNEGEMDDPNAFMIPVTDESK